jgi:hypothetical protein
MGALAVGVLVVLVSSVAIGAAMFGRRPIPQPATASVVGHPAAVTPPSSPTPRDAARRPVRSVPTDLEETRVQVTVPTPVKVRSGVLLGLGVLAIAAFVGVVLSLAVVALGLLIS